jgi:hypothetical protein
MGHMARIEDVKELQNFRYKHWRYKVRRQWHKGDYNIESYYKMLDLKLYSTTGWILQKLWRAEIWIFGLDSYLTVGYQLHALQKTIALCLHQQEDILSACQRELLFTLIIPCFLSPYYINAWKCNDKGSREGGYDRLTSGHRLLMRPSMQSSSFVPSSQLSINFISEISHRPVQLILTAFRYILFVLHEYHR